MSKEAMKSDAYGQALLSAWDAARDPGPAGDDVPHPVTAMKTVIEMAREVGFDDYEQDGMILRLAELVRADERESLKKMVFDDAWALTFQTFGQYRTALVAAIRARGNT